MIVVVTVGRLSDSIKEEGPSNTSVVIEGWGVVCLIARVDEEPG